MPKCDCGNNLVLNREIRVDKYFKLDDDGCIETLLNEWNAKNPDKKELLYCNNCKNEYECEETGGQYYRRDEFEKLFYIEDICDEK